MPIRLEQLTRRYGSVVALDRLDLDVAGGEFLALLGPSGCGKTTALRAIAGFDRPDEGRVLLDGRDITDIPANKRDMGMVFQAYSLFPNLTVARERRLRPAGAPPRQRPSRPRGRPSCWTWSASPTAPTGTPTSSPAASSSASPWPARWPSRPQVLLLDEPLSALDAQVRVQLREEIRRIQLELGHHHRLRHPRPGRGALGRRPGRRHARGPAGAGRRPRRALRAAGHRVRGRVRRHDEPDPRDARRRLRRAARRPPPGQSVPHRRAVRSSPSCGPRRCSCAPTAQGSGRVITRTFSGAVTRLGDRAPTGTSRCASTWPARAAPTSRPAPR